MPPEKSTSEKQLAQDVDPLRLEIFGDFLKDEVAQFYSEEGFDLEKVSKKKRINLHALNIIIWLGQEEKIIYYWYVEAFKKFGKDAHLADGWRVGYIKCNCEKCEGKICRTGQFFGTTMTPRLSETLSRQGYPPLNDDDKLNGDDGSGEPWNIQP